MNVKTLERCFVERIDREKGDFDNPVGDKTRNAILTAIYSIFTPKIELTITSVMTSSERGKHIGITATFDYKSERNYTLYVLNTNDDIRNNNPDELKELSVPDTPCDRQPHTHYSYHGSKLRLSLERCNMLLKTVILNVCHCMKPNINHSILIFSV